MTRAELACWALVAALVIFLLSVPMVAFGQDRAPQDAADASRAEAEAIARDFAQEGQGAPLDLDVEEMLARTERFAADAEAMAETFRSRMAELEGNRESFFTDDGGIDAAALAGAAGALARADRDAADASAQVFTVFVSLSMPDAALIPLLRDTQAAGGQIVVRGFYGGDVGSFRTRLTPLVEAAGEVGLGVDPRLFQAYGVELVPSFAVGPGDAACDGFTCAPLPHDKLAGNISVAAALRLLADRGEVAPAKAKAALTQLESAP